jgi:hypothetical protein
MTNYLKSLAQHRKKAPPIEILWEVAQAFDEADPQSPARTLPRARALHELVRFVKFDTIAPWLENERDVLRRVLVFAQKIKDDKLSAILASALDGAPEPAAIFTVTVPGKEPQVLDIDAGAAAKLAGKDWGATDLALSFAMDGYEAAVLDELIEAADEFDLQPPLAVRRRAHTDLAIAAAKKDQSAADLFRKLVSAKKSRIEAGEWEDAENSARGKGISLPITHVCGAPASKSALLTLTKRYGDAIKDLLDIYAIHDGAELFQYQGECGFYMAPIDQWDELLAQAVQWAEDVTWQEEKQDIPRYLYTAVAFGMIPGDSERWLLITEGKHAGTIMLSDTDLTEDEPRFESLTQFMSTLLNDTGRILNCGGHVRYEVKGEELFPIQYLAQ